MSDELQKTSKNKKILIRQGLLLAVIFSFLVAIALGWFASNQHLSAGGVQLTPSANDVSASLYRLLDNKTGNEDADWEQVENLVISEYVPSEIKTYKIVLTNISTSLDHTSAVQFVNLSNTKELDGALVDSEIDLEKQIYLTSVLLQTPSLAWTPPALPQSIGDLFEADTRNFYIAKNVAVGANTDPTSSAENVAEILFTFKLSEYADNNYQNKMLTAESILITTI